MSDEQLLAAVKELIADVFQVPLESIGNATKAGEFEGWDSLGHVLLIGELERRFGMRFTLQETTQLTAISAIVQLIEAKGLSANRP